MGLFSKNNIDKELIETVGPIPEGYHVVQILTYEITTIRADLLEKLMKDLRRQCSNKNLDGYANLKFSVAQDASQTSIYGMADGIKHD